MSEIHAQSTDFAFYPPLWMRPAMVQTALASLKFRKSKAKSLVKDSEYMILNCQDGVRLSGWYAPHASEKGLVILFHGWEGSHASTYVLSTSQYLYGKGYSIFRLNFRDHGDSHHLNEDVFHSERLGEIQEAVKAIGGLEPNAPVYIVGFSLGGNFALRVVREFEACPIENLKHVFAISPVVDPLKASPKIDDNLLIRRYFYKKWTASLLKKQAAFPERYDFSELLEAKTVMGITDKFLPQYTPFEGREDYFNSYRLWPNDLSKATVPTSIIMAQDDPVTPSKHLNELQLSPCVRRIMLKYGGHNGFFQSVMGPTWYEDYIASVICEGK